MGEPKPVRLIELVRDVRRDVGYYVHPEVGVSSFIVQGVHLVRGVFTRKTSLSQYRENVLLEAAVDAVLGHSYARAASWERTRGDYGGIIYDEGQARLIKQGLEWQMRNYLSKKPSKPKL